MENRYIVDVIVGLIMLIAVLVPVTISAATTASSPTYVVNESHSGLSNGANFTTTYTPVDWGPTGSAQFQVINASGFVLSNGGNYTLLGYNSGFANYNGTIWLNNWNQAVGGAVLKVSYDYQQSGYDPVQTDHTIYSIIPLGVGLGALVLVFTGLVS